MDPFTPAEAEAATKVVRRLSEVGASLPTIARAALRAAAETRAREGDWNLVITSGDPGRRVWFNPKWYVVNSVQLSAGSPWPFKMAWRPVPDPARICVRCAADKTEGTIWTDPEGVIDGAHCIPCRDELRPEPEPSPWAPPSRWVQRAYWGWCELFGKRVKQQEPTPPE